MRDTDIPAAGCLPWGSHFACLYSDRDDLVEVLVPYFKKGLEHNELCLWVAGDPLPAEEAKAELRRAVPELDRHLEDGQIEIHDEREWYQAGTFDADRALELWTREEKRAADRGYAGLRASGGTSWLERSGWDEFVAYERRVNGAFEGRRLLGLCAYDLGRCSGQDVLDIAATHRLTVARDQGRWRTFESSAPGSPGPEGGSSGRGTYASLQASLRERDELLGMLGQELRGRLDPIRDAVQLLDLDAGGGSQRWPVDVLARHVEHLASLARDISDFADVMTGKVRLDTRPVDLRRMATHALEVVRPLIESRRHTLYVKSPGTPLTVAADPMRLSQVIQGLLSNAAKYTPKGGRIWVVSRDEAASAVLSVCDDGIGIHPDLLPRIFDLVGQEPRSISRTREDFGTDLPLARAFVELLGGTIEAHSAGPDQGSEFVLRLPLSSASPER